MIYRFTIISDESDDFRMEIQIDPDETFLVFHKAILEAAGYSNDQLTSFFTCDDDWSKEKEITLEDMDNSYSDSYVMADTRINELVEDEKQKLIYIFDYMTDRCFFIQLSEIITGKDIKGAKCTKKKGTVPKQTIDFEEAEKKTTTKSEDLGENFYGDQDYSLDDIDRDSFEGLEGLGDDQMADNSDIY